VYCHLQMRAAQCRWTGSKCRFFLLIRTRRLWEIFTFCTTIDHCTKKHPSFIEIGQRLLAKVVFTDRQTDRQTDGRRTDNIRGADNQTKKQSVWWRYIIYRGLPRAVWPCKHRRVDHCVVVNCYRKKNKRKRLSGGRNLGRLLKCELFHRCYDLC